MIRHFICNNCWISWDKETVCDETCPMCALPLTSMANDLPLIKLELILEEPKELN